MPLFGRETRAESQRVERIGQWARRRTPLSLASLMFGIIAVVDAWTMVIGLAAGVVAMVLGYRGLGELKRKPDMQGVRLCQAGMTLGAVGVGLSVMVYMMLR